MAVKIRLKRMGKIRQPFYRVVVVDGRKKRDGKVIEEIGKYHPKEDPSYISVDSERAQYWLGVGAQPSDAVAAILKVTGDWQKFKGLPGAEGTLRVKDAKRDKTELFNEALKDAANEPKSEAVTKRATKAAAAKDTEDKAGDKAEAKADAKSEEKAPEKSDAKAEEKSEDKPDAKAEDTSEEKADTAEEKPADVAAPEDAPAADAPAESTDGTDKA